MAPPGTSAITYLLVVGLQAPDEQGVTPGQGWEEGSVRPQRRRVLTPEGHRVGGSEVRLGARAPATPTSPSFPPDPGATAGT